MCGRWKYYLMTKDSADTQIGSRVIRRETVSRVDIRQGRWPPAEKQKQRSEYVFPHAVNDSSRLSVLVFLSLFHL